MQFLDMMHAKRHFRTICYANNKNRKFQLNIESCKLKSLNLEFVTKNNQNINLNKNKRGGK